MRPVRDPSTEDNTREVTQEAIRGAEPWPSSPTLEDGQLLWKRQVLGNEVTAAMES